MTRQRIRPSLKRSVFHDCPACHGTGVIKTPESMSIEVIRMLLLAAQRPDIVRVTVTVAEDVAEFVNNRKRRDLTQLEDQGGMVVQVIGAKGVSPENLMIECSDSDGRAVRFPEV